MLIFYFPLKTGCLFSKNAEIPSLASSESKTVPNEFASAVTPS